MGSAVGIAGQAEVIDFLASPSTHGGAAVERIETHTSIVFLAGTRAWKLKRAVLFDYVDFSSVERRKTCCEREVHINRRTAPTLYRGVVAVTRAPDGSIRLGGEGTPIDWVVEMNRFEQDDLFDRLAARERLDLALVAPLAEAIARFHLAAERRHDHGGKAGMTWVIDGNAADFRARGADMLDGAASDRLIDAQRTALDRHGALLDGRRARGFVRQCHGDLHLRNIVLVDGRPTLFDAVEFNDEIACVDTLYDLAFLLMDLWRRGLRRHANAVFNGYLAETGDLEGLSLLPLFLSCRAAVRAKTSVTAARFQSDPQQRRDLAALGRDYLALAATLLEPPGPRLIAVGGLSGSGKSTLSLALAPSVGGAPGAVVLRSDEMRKRLCGVAPLDRLSPDGYTPEMSQRVYATLAERAAMIVRSGHAAIVDAVFARPEDRLGVERVAAETSVPFVGLWLDAPPSVMFARLRHRQADPSDAGADVLRGQLNRPTGPIGWHRIEASAPRDTVLGRVLALSLS